LRNAAIKRAAKARIIERNRAVFMLSLPEAMGLSLFQGCALSFSLSSISLKRYTELLARQKTAKPRRERKTGFHCVKLNEKIRPANRNRFLIHCVGRREISMALSFVIINPA
jgi:hypothetical protein